MYTIVLVLKTAAVYVQVFLFALTNDLQYVPILKATTTYSKCEKYH